jgi:hypothetical protein
MHAMACTRLDISFVMGQVDKFQSVFPTCDIMMGQICGGVEVLCKTKI